MEYGVSAIAMKNFKFKSLLFVLLVGAALALSAGTASAAGRHDNQGNKHGAGLALPVTGTFAPAAASGALSALGSGSFAGTFNVQRFQRENLQVVAVGTLTGTLTDTAGNLVRTVVKADVALPLTLTAQATGTGTVTLPLGPVSIEAPGSGIVINLNATSVSIMDPPILTTLLNDLATLITNLVTGVSELTVTVVNGLVSLLNQILALLV